MSAPVLSTVRSRIRARVETAREIVADMGTDAPVLAELYARGGFAKRELRTAALDPKTCPPGDLPVRVDVVECDGCGRMVERVVVVGRGQGCDGGHEALWLCRECIGAALALFDEGEVTE